MNVNMVSVVITAVVNMVLGFLWYSPLLFGKQWMKLEGKKESDMKKGGMSSGMYVSMFVMSLLMAYVLALFVQYTGTKTTIDGAKTGFWLWLGFIATTHFSTVLFSGKPKELYALTTGYYLVSLILMGALLTQLG